MQSKALTLWKKLNPKKKQRLNVMGNFPNISLKMVQEKSTQLKGSAISVKLSMHNV